MRAVKGNIYDDHLLYRQAEGLYGMNTCVEEVSYVIERIHSVVTTTNQQSISNIDNIIIDISSYRKETINNIMDNITIFANYNRLA